MHFWWLELTLYPFLTRYTAIFCFLSNRPTSELVPYAYTNITVTTNLISFFLLVLNDSNKVASSKLETPVFCLYALCFVVFKSYMGEIIWFYIEVVSLFYLVFFFRWKIWESFSIACKQKCKQLQFKAINTEKSDSLRFVWFLDFTFIVFFHYSPL